LAKNSVKFGKNGHSFNEVGLRQIMSGWDIHCYGNTKLDGAKKKFRMGEITLITWRFIGWARIVLHYLDKLVISQISKVYAWIFFGSCK